MGQNGDKKRSDKKLLDRGKYDIDRIRRLLVESPRKSKELIQELGGISSSIFRLRINKLIKNGEVTKYEDPQDKRRKLYRIVSEEKAKAITAIFSETQFLESFADPDCTRSKTMTENYDITLDIFNEAPSEVKPELQELLWATVQSPKLLEEFKEKTVSLMDNLPVDKMAFVFTVKKREALLGFMNNVKTNESR